MTNYDCCGRRLHCTLAAVILGLIAGVVAAFLQITGTVTVAPVFLWAALGFAVVYLVALVLSSAVRPIDDCRPCVCRALNALLVGLLGTALFALILLAVGVVATSILSAVLVGFVVLFLTLTLASTVCLVRCLNHCER